MLCRKKRTRRTRGSPRTKDKREMPKLVNRQGQSNLAGITQEKQRKSVCRNQPFNSFVKKNRPSPGTTKILALHKRQREGELTGKNRWKKGKALLWNRGAFKRYQLSKTAQHNHKRQRVQRGD